MTPIELRITNFRSVRGTQTFRFPTGPGLYFMRGQNLSQPRLGGNGAGKSTVWDALTWVLYGKTARGLGAGNVCNWSVSKGTEVEFDYLGNDGQRHTLRRTWGPITLKLDGEDQNALMAAQTAGLDYEPFLQCILMAQAQPMFLDLKPDAKASLFAEVLALDAWLERAKRASAEAGTIDLMVRQLERDLARLQGQQSVLQDSHSREAFDAWEIQRGKRLQEITVTYERLCDRSEQITAGLVELQRVEGAAHDTWRGADMAARAAHTAAGKLEQRIATVTGQISSAEDEVLRLDQAGRAWTDTCSACGQKLTTASREAHKRQHRQGLQDAGNRLDDLRRNVREAREDLAKTEKVVATAEQQLELARVTADAASAELHKAQRELADAEHQLDRLEQQSEDVEQEVNPHAAAVHLAEQASQTLRDDLYRVEGELQVARERYDLLALWSKGFKELRLKEIDLTLVQFEIEVNNALNALGLPDWMLAFAVDKESAKGKVSRGFNVSVYSPDQQRPVPWEAYSGGEGQRLRVAGNMGLGDLIRDRSGCGLDLEVWDEPTNWMSPQGVEDLLQGLATRAREKRRQVWIVDHRSFTFGGFAGEALVIKGKDGTRIVQKDRA